MSRIVSSPNHGERLGGRRPDLLLLHYTGMPTADAALQRLCDPTAEVSAHYLVEEDGTVLQLVAEERRAWHAGASAWAGERDVNSASIGIEIVNPGHDGGLPPYPAVQIEAVGALSRTIVARWTIPPHRVLAHSDVAPDRKQDPGELFPWRRLHELGIGHWVEPAEIREGTSLRPGASGPEVGDVQASLARYGYDVSVTATYDLRTEQAVAAFQRHFRPKRVDGVADPSTVATLADLLAARSRG